MTQSTGTSLFESNEEKKKTLKMFNFYPDQSKYDPTESDEISDGELDRSGCFGRRKECILTKKEEAIALKEQ
jgi:hypothetical protein